MVGCSSGLYKLLGTLPPFHVFCRSCEDSSSIQSFPIAEHPFRALPHLGPDAQQLQSLPLLIGTDR